MFVKIGAKVIEAEDFLNIFLRFWVFEVNFLIKVFLIKKKTCMEIANENVQKHLGLFLDVKLNFLEHINEKIKKANKGIDVIKLINLSLPFFIDNNLQI